MYLTALHRTSPSSGPAITFSAEIPDLDHYKGSFGGRVFPLWRDAAATQANLPPKLLDFLAKKYKFAVTPEDFLAYLAAVAANPAYTARFQADLTQPGLRIPMTARPKLCSPRPSSWVGESSGCTRSASVLPTPRPAARRGRRDCRKNEPRASRKTARSRTMPIPCPTKSGMMKARYRLLVGRGFIDNVPPAVWRYEVSGKRVLTQWFSYRKKNRERPIIGDRRPPSKLGDIQPDHWLAEYTTELLNVLHVLALLVEMEPAQAKLLEAICEGPTLDFRR